MNKVFYFLFFAVIFSLSLNKPILAAQLKDLYQARVAVDSQKTAERSKALKEALSLVFNKIGPLDSRENAAINSAINDANRFLLQYQYEQIAGKNYLLVDFDADKINSLFKSQGIDIWGVLRPQILLWLVDENKLDRKVISASSSSPLVPLVTDYAQNIGLPLLLPLMDLDDIDAISMSDIWGRFYQPLNTASSRYLADKIVVIRISNHSLLTENNDADCLLCAKPSYVVDATILDTYQNFYQSYQGDDINALVINALDNIRQNLFEHYALATSINNTLLIDVSDVNNIASYVKVVSFLESLPSVESVRLIEAEGNMRRFELQVVGAADTIFASLRLSKNLTQHIDPLAVVTPDMIPLFNWQD